MYAFEVVFSKSEVGSSLGILDLGFFFFGFLLELAEALDEEFIYFPRG